VCSNMLLNLVLLALKLPGRELLVEMEDRNLTPSSLANLSKSASSAYERVGVGRHDQSDSLQLTQSRFQCGEHLYSTQSDHHHHRYPQEPPSNFCSPTLSQPNPLADRPRPENTPPLILDFLLSSERAPPRYTVVLCKIMRFLYISNFLTL